MSFKSQRPPAATLGIAATLLCLLTAAASGQTSTTTIPKKTTTTAAPPPAPKPQPVSRPQPQPASVSRPAAPPAYRPAAPSANTNQPSQPARAVAVPHPVLAPLPRPGLPERSEHPDRADHPAIGALPPMHRADPILAKRLDQPRPSGYRDIRTPDGGFARTRPDGRLADFHDPRRNAAFHNNLAGGNRIEVERRNHDRVVIDRGRHSFIEHPYAFRDREFARRTYVDHGRSYQRFYAPYGFHGVRLAVYTPTRFYSPGFYGYAFRPFRAPVVYVGPPVPPPVAAYSAAYYTPPVIAGPPQYLAAFTMQTSLAAGYQAQAANGSTPAPIPPGNQVSDDVQQQLANEIQNLLALENSEAAQETQGQPIDPASSSIARMLSDGQPHVFVAGSEVDAVDATGNECAITEGDVLALDSEPEPDSTVATLSVLASKGNHECMKGTFVTIALNDLQEMQNHLRETVDDGLEQLQTAQANGSMPPAPAGIATPPVTAAFAAIAPPPDPYAQKEIDKELKETDKSIGSLPAKTSASD